jgi:tRNA-dihydrouridine synthase B
LKKHLSIPVIANGDVTDYDDGVAKLQNLDGFMIGRASFGNPWCFLPGKYRPTLSEILNVMESHGELLVERKGRKGALEARKHLVEYLHGFPGVKTYRTRLVSVENFEDIRAILADIRNDSKEFLNVVPEGSVIARKFEGIENCAVD